MTELKVVTLKSRNSEVKDEIEDTLIELLNRAKNQEFEGFAWTASLPDGSVKTGYTSSIDFHCLLSGVVTLQHRMIANRMSEEEKD